ncbi:MAG: outer membrane lipoprotein chaperone LolA [Gammaproteobacteria bacterium]|nr:outer membrane lipoprotein chaperone LolA [Gammaproteobacteria bacterium]
MRRLLWAVVAAAVPAGFAGADTAADARATARLTAALASLQGLRAEFRQTVTDANGERVETAEGRLSLARPGRFRWDYRTPPQLIISDGTTVWLYDVDLAQVTVRAASETLAGTPALLLSGEGDLAEVFAVSDGGEADGLAWSRLVPRDGDGDFSELSVGIAGGELRRMTFMDRLGQTTRLEFTRIERNPRFDPATFTFTPPPGVDVVGRAPPGGG